MRSGVRDTPSRAENCSSTTRSPGCGAPDSTMSRSSEMTLSICAAMRQGHKVVGNDSVYPRNCMQSVDKYLIYPCDFSKLHAIIYKNNG